MNRKFFEYEPNELNFVVFDIETTGFKSGEDDFVTTIIANHKNRYNVWLNTNGDSSVSESDIETKVLENSSTIENINLTIYESEKQLLYNFHQFVKRVNEDNVIFTAFNGETYSGHTDFDVPFLRTRYFVNGLEWALRNVWYMDSYEVFSKKNRIDTTVTGKPTLDDLKKSELQQFVDDMNIDVHYSKMNKSEIIGSLNKKQNVTKESVKEWAIKSNIKNFDESNLDSFTSTELKKYIDDNSIDISYDKLLVSELREQIKNANYNQEMVVEWYDNTGRDIGTREMTKLDGIHKQLVETRTKDSEWVSELPFELEIFEPIDPYKNSNEAVTGFENKEYSNVILHCLADVARTVNLTRILIEYSPQQDYKPKTL